MKNIIIGILVLSSIVLSIYAGQKISAIKELEAQLIKQGESVSRYKVLAEEQAARAIDAEAQAVMALEEAQKVNQELKDCKGDQ